jgi:hypothetical protein
MLLLFTLRKTGSFIPLLLIFESCFAAKEKAASLADFLVRTTDSPGLTDWGPSGKRVASQGELSSQTLPDGDHYHTFHGSVRSSDEVNIVFSPVVEKIWTAESEAFLTETRKFRFVSVKSSLLFPLLTCTLIELCSRFWTRCQFLYHTKPRNRQWAKYAHQGEP